MNGVGDGEGLTEPDGKTLEEGLTEADGDLEALGEAEDPAVLPNKLQEADKVVPTLT